MRVSASVSIPAEPAVVWGRLLEWERQPEWMVDAVSVRVLTTHREGPGVKIAVRTKVLGVPLLTDVLEVRLWEPPTFLVMARKGFVRGLGMWRLDAGPGGTRFTWTEALKVPVPLLGELALRAYRPIMRRLMRRSLERFAGTVRDERAGRG